MNNIRTGYAVIFVVCAGLLGYAYYTQYWLYLNPCPLCILQRIAFMIMGLAALVGLLHGPRGWGRWVYAVVIWLGAAWGVLTAWRHVWLQNLPPDQVPDCGPGLGFMLDNFPLSEALNMIFTGSGECAEQTWSFLGLSMPAWTLIWYLLVAAFTLWITLRAPRTDRS